MDHREGEVEEAIVVSWSVLIIRIYQVITR